MPDPFEELEAVHLRHFQIAQDNVWARKAIPIRVRPLSAKVRDRLLAVGHGLKAVALRGLLEGAPHEKDVVGIIFNEENI